MTSAATIQCDIVSPERVLYSGAIRHCVLTGSEGEIGIYPRHAPLMTKLKAGEVRLELATGEEATYIIGGGILEVMSHVVTILADTAVRAEDVDEAAALRAKAEAERVLRARVSGSRMLEAEARLALALAELKWRREQRKKLK